MLLLLVLGAAVSDRRRRATQLVHGLGCMLAVEVVAVERNY